MSAEQTGDLQRPALPIDNERDALAATEADAPCAMQVPPATGDDAHSRRGIHDPTKLCRACGRALRPRETRAEARRKMWELYWKADD